MRSLEECKAEVFRRSRDRIAKRAKLRNGMLALCMTLAVCLGAWAVLPERDETVGTDGASMENATMGVGDLGCASVKILSEGGERTIEDRETVMALYDAVRALAEVDGTNGNYGAEGMVTLVFVTGGDREERFLLPQKMLEDILQKEGSR